MIPKKYDKPVSLQELVNGYCLSINNAIRLIDDAEILINNNRFVGAINYLILARQELAKSHLINNAIFIDENDKKKWKWFWMSFKNHIEKERILEYELHCPYYKNKEKFHERVNHLMKFREASIYIDFDPNNQKFVTPEEIISERQKLEEQAKLLFEYSLKLLEIFCVAGKPKPEVIFEVFKEQRDRLKK